VYTVSTESDEGVTDVELSLGAKVLVQVQHGGCDAGKGRVKLLESIGKF
jgi:hypothetical protein